MTFLTFSLDIKDFKVSQSEKKTLSRISQLRPYLNVTCFSFIKKLFEFRCKILERETKKHLKPLELTADWRSYLFKSENLVMNVK